MVYQGSKNKYAKYIVPMINDIIFKNNINTFIDAMIGGANLIANPKYTINCNNKYGYDINKYLIALLKKVQQKELPVFSVSKNKFLDIKNNIDNYPDCVVGYVGFICVYGGKFLDGYISNEYKTKDGNIRYFYNERVSNINKQREQLLNVKLDCKDFFDIDFNEFKKKETIIYIDPPYQNKTKYNKIKSFDYNLFWDKVRELSKDYIVIVSEYNAPDDFISIWSKNITFNSLVRGNSNNLRNTENLYIIKDYWWDI